MLQLDALGGGGGFLLLLKYDVPIDPLLRSIEQCNLGCTIAHIPTCPAGFAANRAAFCLSKPKIDRLLTVAHEYRYNTQKSALKVHRETLHKHLKGKKCREFKMWSSSENNPRGFNYQLWLNYAKLLRSI